MNPLKDQYNALQKIHSIVFNMAQEGRINAAELEDYNAAAAKASEAMEDWKFLLRQAREEKKAAAKARDKMVERERKYKTILQMMGITDFGRNRLLSFPLRFLLNVNRALVKNETTLAAENHFRAIDQAGRWLMRMIDRDRRNIETIKLQKKLYESNHEEVRKMAADIMKQIAQESNHIVDGLRKGESFDELRTKIEQHWYEQLSAYYFK